MRKQKNNNHIILKDDDKIIRDQREMAETLNEFFRTNTSKEQTNVIKNTDLMSDFMHIPSDINIQILNTEERRLTNVSLLHLQRNDIEGKDNFFVFSFPSWEARDLKITV